MERSEASSAGGEAIVLVLAAGRGTRMGTPKALMSVLGAPWWRRQEDAIACAGLASLWVVSERVRRDIGGVDGRRMRILTARDDAPMYESFRAGIDALREGPPTGVFVLPVDVPLARTDVLKALRAAGPVAAPRIGGRGGHPLWLAWEWLTSMLAREHGERLDGLTGGDRVLVDVDDPFVAMNLNRPSDVDAFERSSRERLHQTIGL